MGEVQRVVLIIDPEESTDRAIGRIGRKRDYVVRYFSDAQSFIAALPEVQHIFQQPAVSACMVFDASFAKQLSPVKMPRPIRSLPRICLYRPGRRLAAGEFIQNVGHELIEKPFRLVQIEQTIELALEHCSAFLAQASEFERFQSGMTTLTKREREICQLLGWGLSPRAISKRLGISEKTFYTHRSNLMQKTGLVSSTQLSRVGHLVFGYSGSANCLSCKVKRDY